MIENKELELEIKKYITTDVKDMWNMPYRILEHMGTKEV